MAAARTKKPASKLKASQKKKTNKWLIIGGIVAIAIIGAIVVRVSGASNCGYSSTRYSFVHCAKLNQIISGNQGTMTYDSTKYSLISRYYKTWGYVNTIVSRDEASRSKDICAHFKIIQSPAPTKVTITQTLASGKVLRRNQLDLKSDPNNRNVCLKQKPASVDSIIYVQASVVQPALGTLGVDTIYGTN